MKHYRLIFTPLSPIHIGCGENYDPTGYMIPKDEHRLYPFDTASMGRLLTLDKIRQKFESADLKGLQQAFQQEPDLHYLAQRYVPMIDSAYDKYSRWLPGGKQCDIERTHYDILSERPIIPGTAIKGAIRTAVLNHLASNKPECESKNLEECLLGGAFSGDPMRHCKIGDAHYQDVPGRMATRIMTRHNRHRSNGTKTSMSDNSWPLAECISPFMGQSFVAEMVLQKGIIPNMFSMCNKFYINKIYEHKSILDRLKQSYWSDSLLLPIQQAVDDKKGFLLRIGKHCGADSLVVDKYKDIKTKYKNKTPESITLCCISEDILAPFGWFFIEVCPDNSNEGGSNDLINTVDEISRQIYTNDLNDWQVFIKNRKAYDERWEQRRAEEEKKAAERRVAEEKKAAERRVAEEKKAAIQRAEEERKAAEQERRAAERQAAVAAEAERQRQRSAMTDVQRQIDDLRQAIRDCCSSDELWKKVQLMAKESLAWQQPDKDELHLICRNDLFPKLKTVGDKKKKELLGSICGN
ncbi:MAG: type III-A CRISPR-associated RAMP protein Csm5 [Magnetococcales bacterium]|nr:type III-A CRISPR-associated RAMP protein Csm5 [Magnetococcales bacterium]